MNPRWIDVALAVALAGLLFGAGWVTQGWRKDAEISRIKTEQQKQRGKALSDALTKLSTAQATSEKLVAVLANSENARTQLAEEKDLEIRRLTTGRRCLDAAVVSVLNSDAAASLPQAGPEPVPADGAFTTDTDVGLWARICRDRFDTCRNRLNAINAFYKEEDRAR